MIVEVDFNAIPQYITHNIQIDTFSVITNHNLDLPVAENAPVIYVSILPTDCVRHQWKLFTYQHVGLHWGKGNR